MSDTIVSVRYGKMFTKRHSVNVFVWGVDKAARGNTPLQNILDKTGSLGSIYANGSNDSNGMMYGNNYWAKEGEVVVLKYMQKFGVPVLRQAVLPIRLRSHGPMVIVRGNYPAASEFDNTEDILLFSGRGDVLDEEDIENLGLVDCFSQYDRNMGFDPEQREECFSIEVNKRVPDYEDRPQLVPVIRDGEIVDAIALPSQPSRRIRVNRPTKPPMTTRRRRRRT